MTKYLVCKCGWKSEPYPDTAVFMGLGGILSCPECTRFKHLPNLEGCFGSVHIETVQEPFNPSKRENENELPLDKTPFYCEYLDMEITPEFCRNCETGKRLSVPCKWSKNMQMKPIDVTEKIREMRHNIRGRK